MNILQKIAATGALAALAGAGVTAATASAANAGWSDCPASYLCAYLSANGDGTPGKVQDDNSDLLQYNKFNNAVSLYNHGNNCNVAIYSGRNWSGSRYVLARGSAIYNLGDSGWEPWYKNVASNDWCV